MNLHDHLAELAVAIEVATSRQEALAALAQYLASDAAAQLSRQELAEGGALMSYGPDNADMYRRGASYVDRILRGPEPRGKCQNCQTEDYPQG